ncbi:unnamed protein product [Schistosoma mattheei]|uniref:Uncharacterized protein n=1 Tax=Schistosoma mattheei TaxID=31246 RepID=A0AA85BX85_9TREM|nr:unnamed protein product [Schistosoma mattheei]
MEHVNTDQIHDNELKMTTTKSIHNITTSIGGGISETTEYHIITDTYWTEKEQRATVIIAVALVAIITICVILIILRTLRKKSNKTSRGVEERGNYSCMSNDNHSEPKWIVQQQLTVGHTSDRIRKVPTRNPENKKWYDSAAIPFMDDVSSSTDNLHTDQLKNQQI